MSETRASVRARSVDVRGGKREIADVLEESRERHNQPVVTLRVERHAMAAAADAPRMPPRAGWTEVVVALPLPMGIGFDRYNVVSELDPAGSAARDGRVRVGDCATHVNGVEVCAPSTHRTAHTQRRRSPLKATGLWPAPPPPPHSTPPHSVSPLHSFAASHT